MIQFSALFGQSNVSRVDDPLEVLLDQQFGANNELFVERHDGQRIESWVASTQPCVQGPLLIADLALLDARIAALGIANIDFETLYIVQGEADTSSEARMVAWPDRAGCWIDEIQNHLQTNYGKQFGHVVIMVIRLERTDQTATDSDRLRSELSCDLAELQKAFANSRPDLTYVESNDLPRADLVHLDTAQGVIVAERLFNSAMNKVNFPSLACGLKT